MFNYILPFANATLHAIRASFGLERTIPVQKSKKATITPRPVVILQRNSDAHVRRYWQWQKEEQKRQRREILEQERIAWEAERAAWLEQQEAWHVLQQTKRDELLRRKKEEQEEREFQTLLHLLASDEVDTKIREALLRAWSNIVTIARKMGITALKHYGIVLTAEQHNHLMHSLNGNIKASTIARMEQKGRHTAPYGPYTTYGSTRQRDSTRPWKQVQQDAVPVGEMSTRVMKKHAREEKRNRLTVKKPWNFNFDHGYREIRELTAFETPAEHMGRLEGWRYKVGADQGDLRVRKLPYDRRVDLSTRVYDRPGYCYLLLIKREHRNEFDWPKYPTIHDVLSWEPELRDYNAAVNITREGIRLFHVGRGMNYGWDELERMASNGFGQAMIGGTTPPSYVDVARIRKLERLIQKAERIERRNLFNNTILWEAHKENPIERARRLGKWQRSLQRNVNLPPPRGTTTYAEKFTMVLKKTEVEKIELCKMPGYCYMLLFESIYYPLFDWPECPTWSEIEGWNESLRKIDATFHMKKQNGCWHLENDGIRTWYTVLQMRLSPYCEDQVGFLWTEELANMLLSALHGWKEFFSSDGPILPAIPAELGPEYPPSPEREQYERQRQELINESTRIQEGRTWATNAIGQAVAGMVNEMRNQPPKQVRPQLKLDPPDHYEGDPAEIDNWLRSMEVYLVMVGMDSSQPDHLSRTILIALQRVRKGKANRAGAWAAVKLREWIDAEKEYAVKVQKGEFPETQNRRHWRDGRMDPLDAKFWKPLDHKPPFLDWPDFCEQAKEFFMTTETQDEAIRQMNELKQQGPVEDYIIKFKSLAILTGYNDYALVASFRKGLAPSLGYDIVRSIPPADDDLETWYQRSTEMARAYRDAKKYYGDPRKQIEIPTTSHHNKCDKHSPSDTNTGQKGRTPRSED